MHSVSEEDISLLREIATAREPDLLPLIEDVIGRRPLSGHETRRIVDLLTAETLASFDATDHPTGRGVAADDLAQRLTQRADS